MIATCPTEHRLQQFSLGRLNEEQSDLLFSHVSDCPDCQQRLGDDASEDTLVNRLKESSNDTKHAVQEFEKEAQCQAAVSKALAALADVQTGELDTKLPEKIGDYEILRLIGRGGMGSVYLAKHAKLGRQVALKVIASHRSNDPMMQGRFAKEMQAVGTLNHPNVVAALDAREVDGVAILVTEWIDGLNISEVIHRLGPMKPADAAEVVRQVAEALTSIDEAGLVHRDIKPSNIMLNSNGQVKLLDLGLARLQGDGTHREFTMTGQAIGTADYVAPEQIQGSDSIDIRTDLYGLGCTLFKMLTGKAPFDGPQYSTSFAKMNAHVSAELPVIQRTDVPAPLSALTNQMMAKEAGSRPESARAVSERVKSFAEKSNLPELIRSASATKSVYAESQLKPVSPTTHSKLESNSATLPWWRRPVPLLVALAAGLFGAVIGYALGIIITIQKPDGTTAKLNVPDGAEVTIDAKGNPTVKLPKNGVPNSAPERDSGLIPKGIDIPDIGSELPSPKRSAEPLSDGVGIPDPIILDSDLPDLTIEASNPTFGRSKLRGVWRIEPLISQQSLDSKRRTPNEPNWIVFGDSKVALFHDNLKFAEGTYSIEGDRISIELKSDDQSTSMGITYWTQATLQGKLSQLNNDVLFGVRATRDYHGQAQEIDDLIFQFSERKSSVNTNNLPSMVSKNPDAQAAILAAYQIEMEGQELPTGAKELIHGLEAKAKLRDIAIAMHAYADSFKRLPASKVSSHHQPEDEAPELVSWRVALLPFLGHKELYDQYHFDETWDSANNRKLLKQMPDIYCSPSDNGKDGNTYFLGIAGDHSAIGLNNGFPLASISDGLSRTIMIAEAQTAVPWTKPEDIHFDIEDPFAPNKEWFRKGTSTVAFADGSVRIMETRVLDSVGIASVSLETLKAFLTRDGKEAVSAVDSQLFK